MTEVVTPVKNTIIKDKAAAFLNDLQWFSRKENTNKDGTRWIDKAGDWYGRAALADWMKKLSKIKSGIIEDYFQARKAWVDEVHRSENTCLEHIAVELSFEDFWKASGADLSLLQAYRNARMDMAFIGIMTYPDPYDKTFPDWVRVNFVKKYSEDVMKLVFDKSEY